MGKKIINIFLGVLVFALLIVAVRLKQQSVTKKNNKEVVTFHSEWEKKGKPVRVLKIVPLDLEHKLQITITCRDNETFTAHISKDLYDQIRKDSKVLFKINQDIVVGKIQSMSASWDKDTGLYRVDGILPPNLSLSESSYIADVYAATRKKMIKLPQEAVEMVGDDAYVFLAEGDKFVKRKVTLLDQDGDYIYIKDGVSFGDFVIINGHRNLKENDYLHVVNKGEMQ